MSNGRILSIQSHVVHGYVGNKSAVFPLQTLGFEVDFINSVQFSNHTGYKCFKGQRLNANELNDLFDGLRQNDLLSKYTHLLTGYVGDVTFLSKLAELIDEVKAKNPELIYLCDPVMGDNGKLYVARELVDVYLNKILPKANIVTPNVFELELIYGQKISNETDILNGINVCHGKGIKIVVISSCNTFRNDDSRLVLYASSIDEKFLVKIEFDRLVGTFTGTGDTFAAMFLAWYTKLKNLKSACEHTISAMLHILKRTNEHRQSADQMLEIKLIQSKNDIERPEIVVNALLIPKLVVN